jgi:hypothetical protein
VSADTKVIMGWYSNVNGWADRLKPVPKYAFWIASYTALLLILNLILADPHGLRWSDLLIGPILGAAGAFGSERRRKHPAPPPPPGNRYTNPRYTK